ncbi:hypothetical protein DYB37_008954 [Aphanomyces astaci]|uniref:START domain-containing protein n=1 Tax=Aphanomyces astaci TaxID=112090 RepID=A0A418F8J3_APHAT|nr:hypothetical protein DYB37_008954 [Aphanomyces astaci]
MASKNDGADDETSWTNLLDLPTLLATDDQLYGDMEQLFTILDDPLLEEELPISTNTTTHPVPTSLLHQAAASTGISELSNTLTATSYNPCRRRRTATHQERQKHELLVLRQQVVEMKALLAAKQATSNNIQMSAWERAARAECKEKWISMQENAQLHGAVHEQATFIEHMQRLLQSHDHHLHLDNKDAWQVYRLAAHESLRIAGIHAIADRQLRRMQNAFIQAGVFETSDNTFRAHVRPDKGGSFRFELVNCVTLPAPFAVVAAAAWHVHMGGPSAPSWPDGTTEVVEIIDSHTVYSKLTHVHHGGVPSHANVIRKQFLHPTRHVIVSRSVLEDARDPLMSTRAVEDKWSWLELAACPDDATSCRLTYVVQLDMGHTHRLLITDDEVAGIQAMLQHVSMSEKDEATQDDLDRTTPQHPHMRSFVERGKRYIHALHAAVNKAIRVYHRQNRGNA